MIIILKKHELLITKEEMQQGKNLPHLRNPPVLVNKNFVIYIILIKIVH